jgi:glucokinase
VSEASLAVGIDLGGTNARAALVDTTTGQIQNETRSRLTAKEPREVVRLLFDLVRSVDPERAAKGIGVGVAAMLRDRAGFVLNAPNLGWRDVDFGGMVATELRAPVVVVNDLSAITWGEKMFGAARGIANLACIFIGTGVGCGLVVDGQLTHGAGNVAGEIGHTKVALNGRPCGCGERGCLEAYVSGRHLGERAQQELRAEPFLSPNLAALGDELNASMLDEAARHGDEYADVLWRESAGYLGMTLANLCTLLNPERLVMGGSVWLHCKELRRRTLEIAERLINPPARRGLQIVDSQLADAAGILGAAALAS